jgi:NAD(P)-dependent dehydrogenase (short-subunit alcohol dehydrogenase family)
MKLIDRTAIVTGGGRGIGEAIAMALAAEGARVVIASRTQGELDAVAERGRSYGLQIVACVADVTQASDVDRLIRYSCSFGSGLDILVNNAGVSGPVGPFASSDFEAWWRAVEGNLMAMALCSRMAVTQFVTQRRGKIINLSGGGATSPAPNFSAYAVAKVGIVRLTETLAEELRPFGVQVNAIAPGFVDTRMQNSVIDAGPGLAPEQYQRVTRLRERGEGGVPASLAAELAVFLASDGSGSLTGRLISAPHDPWRSWTDGEQEWGATPMYTLRRLDPYTLNQMKRWS